MLYNFKKVELYTDGACSGNPGPGGWAAILAYNAHEKILSGFVPETTNNRMEIFAAIQGLGALRQPCRVSVYTDSAYLSEAFNKDWIDRWQLNGWLTVNNNPVENQDLWRQLLAVMKSHSVEWIQVRGHADNERNNRCDKLAVAQIKRHVKKSRKPKDEKNGGTPENAPGSIPADHI